MQKIRYIALVCLSFFQNGSFAAPAKAEQYDIVVYGATSAGVIAAYTARKMGKSVVIVEPGKHLGGMTSGGLGYTDIGNKYAITGLSRDFYRRIGKHYGKFEQWTFEPHVAKKYLQQYLDEVGVKVLNELWLKEVKKGGAEVKSIVLADMSRKGQTVEIGARMFIDCSYEGDLMAKAGVSYSVGREANSEFNETINGVQLMKGHQFPDGIDPYEKEGDSSSGLLWGISNAKLDADGTGDKKIQAYNYRICLTSDASNRIPITKPEGYDARQFELLARLIARQPDRKKLNDYFIWSKMPNQKTDINNRNGFSTDMIGMNYEYPEADFKKRAAIIKEHELYTKGLLYFFGHDPRVPKEIRDEMLLWGYPKDEYTDTQNWSPQLYVRETRRMKGEYVMSQANCQAKEVVTDGVGMAAYTMDSHNCQRIVVNGMVKNEGNVEVGGFGPYPISYRSLVPKSSECTNMLVPVCLSATHIAYGSIRMEPVFMVLGQSSAVAAVMAIDAQTSVQKVNVPKLQTLLKSDPLVNGSTPEQLVDDNDAAQVMVSGDWTKLEKGGYGASFLKNNGAGAVEYKPSISKSGNYRVYLYVPKVADMAPEFAIDIRNGSTSKRQTVLEGDIKVEGQTSGEWYHVGDFDIRKDQPFSLKISKNEKPGMVVADALLLVPDMK